MSGTTRKFKSYFSSLPYLSAHSAGDAFEDVRLTRIIYFNEKRKDEFY